MQKVKKFLKSNEIAISLMIKFFGEAGKILVEYFK
jgi:hypothetical protein